MNVVSATVCRTDAILQVLVNTFSCFFRLRYGAVESVSKPCFVRNIISCEVFLSCKYKLSIRLNIFHFKLRLVIMDVLNIW
jgi:hypothetical protein